jgi:hypothetical protein
MQTRFLGAKCAFCSSHSTILSAYIPDSHALRAAHIFLLPPSNYSRVSWANKKILTPSHNIGRRPVSLRSLLVLLVSSHTPPTSHSPAKGVCTQLLYYRLLSYIHSRASRTILSCPWSEQQATSSSPPTRLSARNTMFTS